MNDVHARLVAYLRTRGSEAAYRHAGFWVNHVLPGYASLVTRTSKR